MKKPNIVMIISDDQGAWAMANAGMTELHTPTLDRLAAQGRRFDGLYCVSPVCSPARASLLTGTIPSSHGVHDWIRAGNSRGPNAFHSRPISYLDGRPTLADRFAAAGYRVGISGKWHLGNGHEPHKGFGFWRVTAEGGGTYMSPAMIDGDAVVRQPGYLTDIITDNALAFLEEGGDDPYLLLVTYTAPHSPWDHEQHLPDDVARYYPGCAFDSLPRPPMHPDFYNPAAFPETEDARRRILAGYCAAITAMDRGIGRIMDRIGPETLVFFTSDNGMNMGHHGIYGKGNGTWPQNFYETSVRVPGIIWHPERIAPGVLSGVYSHYDLLPSLLCHAGLAELVPEGLPGRDISPVWRDENPDERGFAIVFDEYGPHRMIRQGRWKYIHRYADGEVQLFDLDTDPDEGRNLAHDPQYRTVRDGLAAQMQGWFDRYGQPWADGAGLEVRGGGQIGRVDDPGPRFVDHQDRVF